MDALLGHRDSRESKLGVPKSPGSVMWTSFLRAFFVYGIVLGLEDIGLGIYYAFKQKRIEKLRWLARGISWIAIAALGLWLLKRGWLDSWDEPASLVLALMPAVTMSLFEIYLKVRVEHRPFSSVFSLPEPEAQPQPPGNVQPATTRIALFSGPFSGFFALQGLWFFPLFLQNY